MKRPPPFVVFSDLDGTLLDHTTYDWAAAKPALERLANLGVPVILATSKTAAETQVLQREMGLEGYPAIVENGAGLTTGSDQLPQSHEYAKLRAVLDTLPAHLRASFTGFGDMSATDVVAVTDLPEDAAQQAKTRQFSEPGLWHGTPEAQSTFIAALAEHGVTARAGGRFLTLSFGTTKKDRMAEVADRYGAPTIVALGDAPNDVEMLEAADFGVIVTNPHHPPLPHLDGEDDGGIIRTRLHGPAGWNEAINAFLDRQHPLTKGTKIG